MDFSDVDPAASYGEAVRWAASEGIAGGYGGGLFGPDDPDHPGAAGGCMRLPLRPA